MKNWRSWAAIPGIAVGRWFSLNSSAKIEKILRNEKKGSPGIVLDSCRLLKDVGMDGDRHADGSERQLSLMSGEALDWMGQQTRKGLCFDRFHANLTVSKINFNCLQPGSRLKSGDVVLEISASPKHCYPQCELFSDGSECRLAHASVFARVLQGGTLHRGDDLEVEAKQQKLTHFDAGGNAVMVDVTDKDDTVRVAVAAGIIQMKPETLELIRSGTAKKGDVIGVARVAGIMAAKRTADLIPMCHPLMLTKCSLDFELHENPARVEAQCTVQVTGKTGVEMEALTGLSTALLTIYDMCKAVDRGMVISEIRLMEKSGGKSGHYVRPDGVDAK